MLLRPQMKFLRRTLLLGSLLLAASSSGAPPQLADDSPRWQWFAEHRDSYDLVFVGSSRIYHGISPKLFSEAAGRPWRGFNLGVDRMRTPACLEVARRVLALHPAKLKYLFFELQAVGGPAAAPNEPEVSAASPAISELMPVAFAGGSGIGPDGDGFNPLEKEMKPQFRPTYEQRLEEARARGPKRVDAAMRDELGRFAKEAAAEKIRVLFVVPPSLRNARGSGVDAPAGSLLFSFDDLTRYAPLYDEANRPDAEHLNARGAEIFTRDLAQQFVHALDGAATR